MKQVSCAFLIFIILFTLISCRPLLGDGSDTVVKQSSNNKHTKKAILFLREANATVANSYQVSIIDYKTNFDTLMVGNVFTVDDNHGKARLNLKAVDFNWIADDTLEINYDKNLRTFIQEKVVDGITVVYKEKY